MLAHVNAHAGFQMQGKDLSGAIAAEGDSTWTSRAGQQKRHSGEHPLERTLERMQLDLHRRVFPQQDMVLEINAGGTQFHVQRRHQFTFDVVRHAAKCFILRRGG
jgi:hypothetical protein